MLRQQRSDDGADLLDQLLRRNGLDLGQQLRAAGAQALQKHRRHQIPVGSFD